MAIRAASRDDYADPAAAWAFVDLGFARTKRSCGYLLPEEPPVCLTFGELKQRLCELARGASGPLNLVLEAPLSVAFSPDGNPVGRSFELRNGQSRYWYQGLGCVVLTSATYLLRAMADTSPARDVRLLEGFVSFKPKGVKSSHVADVEALHRVVQGETEAGHVIWPEDICERPNRAISAFAVAGMPYGIPPVVMVNAPA